MKQFKNISLETVKFLTIIIVLLGHSGCSSKDQSKENPTENISMVSEPVIELKLNLRKLWEDHISWTRNVIFCLVDNLPGTDQAVKRQLQNQIDLGNAIKPYYGEEAGEKLTKLLYAHINISLEVIRSAKTGDAAALAETNKRWYANADEISEFLCKANPNWALAKMKMMMKHHLDITTGEVVARIKKDYDSDVVAYDKVHTEIMEMADMLSDGISKQFLEKFEVCGNKSRLK